MEAALEAGAEDFQADEHGYEVLTDPAQFESVHRAIESRGISCESAAVTAIADRTVPLTDTATADAVSRLLDALDDHDDVQQVYSNAEFPPERT
jgi:transcriptional/translational regulatory protein YebC/TACO1